MKCEFIPARIHGVTCQNRVFTEIFTAVKTGNLIVYIDLTAING
jgi:hypothetical protein